MDWGSQIVHCRNRGEGRALGKKRSVHGTLSTLYTLSYVSCTL